MYCISCPLSMGPLPDSSVYLPALSACPACLLFRSNSLKLFSFTTTRNSRELRSPSHSEARSTGPTSTNMRHDTLVCFHTTSIKIIKEAWPGCPNCQQHPRTERPQGARRNAIPTVTPRNKPSCVHKRVVDFCCCERSFLVMNTGRSKSSRKP